MFDTRDLEPFYKLMFDGDGRCLGLRDETFYALSRGLSVEAGELRDCCGTHRDYVDSFARACPPEDTWMLLGKLLRQFELLNDMVPLTADEEIGYLLCRALLVRGEAAVADGLDFLFLRTDGGPSAAELFDLCDVNPAAALCEAVILLEQVVKHTEVRCGLADAGKYKVPHRFARCLCLLGLIDHDLAEYGSRDYLATPHDYLLNNMYWGVVNLCRIKEDYGAVRARRDLPPISKASVRRSVGNAVSISTWLAEELVSYLSAE